MGPVQTTGPFSPLPCHGWSCHRRCPVRAFACALPSFFPSGGPTAQAGSIVRGLRLEGVPAVFLVVGISRKPCGWRLDPGGSLSRSASVL
eukprot:scaffold17377_cov19-Tisochrysis_lutea.AAC.1